MFDKLIKDIRKDMGLTQKEFAVKLSLASPEFSAIDFVTVSRWERGVTAPSKTKALRVLRVFLIDVSPYLSSLAAPLRLDELDVFIYERFESNFQKMTLASLTEHDEKAVTSLSHSKLVKGVDEPVLSALREFHSKYNLDRLDLFDLDIFLYQEERRLRSYRFYNSSDKEDILGHHISFYFDNDVLKDELLINNCDISLKRSSSYVKNKNFALYAVTSFNRTAEAFMYSWKHIITYLAKHANITEFYINVMSQHAVSFLLNNGFDIVTTKNTVKYGGIKVGNRRYERCILKADTSVFLASDLGLYFLTHGDVHKSV